MWTRSWRPRRHSRGSRILAALVALLGGTAASPCTAQTAEVPVDLELVIAVDVSGSIDPEEARLQRDGYLRRVPEDPFTKSADTWQTVPAEPDPNNPSSEPGVYDVKSGAQGTALDGSSYSDWD